MKLLFDEIRITSWKKPECMIFAVRYMIFQFFIYIYIYIYVNHRPILMFSKKNKGMNFGVQCTVIQVFIYFANEFCHSTHSPPIACEQDISCCFTCYSEACQTYRIRLFAKKKIQVWSVNYFCEKIHFRCLAGFCMVCKK